MDHNVIKFANSVEFNVPGRLHGAIEPSLATVTTTAATALTCITAAFGYHDAKRVDVMAEMDVDAPVDEMLAIRSDALKDS